MVSVGVAMSLLVVLLRCAVASKEQIDPDTQAAVESIMKSNLWQQIRKRLQDAGIPSEEIDGLEDVKESQSQDSCNFDYEEGIIIRTHDSISSGATFIGAPDVITKNQCSELCCKSQTCNTAVFKNKDEDNSCYLFDCGTPNVCKFTNHPGYIIARLPKRHTSNKLQEKHEVDLESLAETTTTTATTTTTSTTTTPTTTTSAPEPKQPVPLFGKCSSHKDCAGSMSACQAGYCVCQDGFHAQEGVCRKDCGKFEFECANEGHPSSYPQCIAIYDHCDDIIHCNDGSDEKHCKEDAVEPSSYFSQPQALPPQPQSPPLVMVPSKQPPQSPQSSQQAAYKLQQLVPPGYLPQVQAVAPDQYVQPSQSGYGGGQQLQSVYPGLGRVDNMLQPQSRLSPNQQQQLQVENRPAIPVIQYAPQPLPSRNNVPARNTAFNGGQAQTIHGDVPPQAAQSYGSGAIETPEHIAPDNQPRRPLPFWGDVQKSGFHRQQAGPIPMVPSQVSDSADRPAISSYNRQNLNQQAEIPDDSQQNLNQDQRPNIKTSSPPHYQSPDHGVQESKTVVIQSPPKTFHQPQNTGSNNPQPPKPANVAQASSVNHPISSGSNDADSPHRLSSYQFPYQDSRSGYANYPPSSNDRTGYGDGGAAWAGKTRNNYQNKGNRYGNTGYGSSGYFGNDYRNSDSAPDSAPATGRGGSSPYRSDYDHYYDQNSFLGAFNPSSDYNDYLNLDSGQNGYEDKKNGNPYDNQGKPRASTGRDGSAPGGTHVISHPSPDDEQPSSELPAQRPSPPSSRQHVQRPSPPSNRRPPATAKQQPEDTPKLTPASEPVQDQPVRQQQPKDKSHQQPQEKNDDVKDKEKNNPEEDKDSKESERSDSQSKSSESVELDSKPAKPDIPSKEPEVDNPHVPPVDSSSTLAIIKTKIEKVVMPTSTKGAVVALALGLAITAMLLVFVGCRLRNVKHRLRRGRPMNTNEADYLVNGMYL